MLVIFSLVIHVFNKNHPWLFIYAVLNALMFFVLVLLAYIFNSDIPKEEFFSTFILTLATIIAANYFVAVVRMRELRWWSNLVIAVFVLFCVSLITHKIFLIPQIIVKEFKFGNIEARLVLDEQGCAIAKSYKLNSEISSSSSVAPNNITETPTNKTSQANEKHSGIETCLISNIKILSKIGHEFYLQNSGVPRQNGNQKTESNVNNFTIQSEHVLSWSVIEKTPPQPAEN
jgi:hypothetical protein